MIACVFDCLPPPCFRLVEKPIFTPDPQPSNNLLFAYTGKYARNWHGYKHLGDHWADCWPRYDLLLDPTKQLGWFVARVCTRNHTLYSCSICGRHRWGNCAPCQPIQGGEHVVVCFVVLGLCLGSLGLEHSLDVLLTTRPPSPTVSPRGTCTARADCTANPHPAGAPCCQATDC